MVSRKPDRLNGASHPGPCDTTGTIDPLVSRPNYNLFAKQTRVDYRLIRLDSSLASYPADICDRSTGSRWVTPLTTAGERIAKVELWTGRSCDSIDTVPHCHKIGIGPKQSTVRFISIRTEDGRKLSIESYVMDPSLSRSGRPRERRSLASAIHLGKPGPSKILGSYFTREQQERSLHLVR